VMENSAYFTDSERMPACRLILSAKPMDGRWNMAVDEALLEAAITSGQPVIRWYGWSTPTVSLGYFQPEEAVASSHRLGALPRVRRLTGGGAIVHHHEWTYSCVLPPQQKLVRHPYELYDVLHRAVIDWFRDERSISLHLRGASQRRPEEPALCFLREDSHDVCHGDVKVLGSAQRRRKGALLQHGSLILRRSQFAPDVPGLCDLATGTELSARDGQALAWRLVHSVGEKIAVSRLTPEENQRAEEIAATEGTAPRSVICSSVPVH